MPQSRMRFCILRFKLSFGSKNKTLLPMAMKYRAAAISSAVLPDWTLARIVTCSSRGDVIALAISRQGSRSILNGCPFARTIGNDDVLPRPHFSRVCTSSLRQHRGRNVAAGPSLLHALRQGQRSLWNMPVLSTKASPDSCACLMTRRSASGHSSSWTRISTLKPLRIFRFTWSMMSSRYAGISTRAVRRLGAIGER